MKTHISILPVTLAMLVIANAAHAATITSTNPTAGKT
jgi:hypothetical protein